MDNICNNVCLFEICVYIDIFACNKKSLFTPGIFRHISKYVFVPMVYVQSNNFQVTFLLQTSEYDQEIQQSHTADQPTNIATLLFEV